MIDAEIYSDLVLLLGTGEGEAGLELRHLAPLHIVHLVRVVPLPERGQQRLVDPLGMEDEETIMTTVHVSLA